MSSFLLNDKKEFLLTILFLKRKNNKEKFKKKTSFVSSIPALEGSFWIS